MPVLSTAQLAYMRSTKADNYADTLDVYRAPAVAASKRGAVVLLTSGVRCRRWPASKAPKIVALIPDIAGARIDELIFFPDSADVRRGDELRSASGEKLKAEGVGVWQTSIAVAASLVSP
ncbi:MAG: hypothetical protein M3R61_00175 [Chloroflexota bacterium]|nr:hypothetical protein [Chloroflexota bacterium]